MNMLNVSSSPHVRDKDSTRGIMLDAVSYTHLELRKALHYL